MFARGLKDITNEIEIGNAYEPGEWNIDKLIEEAEIISGIRFVQLETNYGQAKGC